MPSEPCTPRDDPLLSVSPISGMETNDDSANDGPTVIVTSPASIAGRSASWLGPVSWAPGMPALPAMPATNDESSEDSSTPTAPAACALLNRAALPHARVASLSSQYRNAILPATAAACSGVNAAQPVKSPAT